MSNSAPKIQNNTKNTFTEADIITRERQSQKMTEINKLQIGVYHRYLNKCVFNKDLNNGEIPTL